MSELTPSGYLARAGGRLIDNGYRIVPIKPGLKHPGYDGWEKTKATKKDWRGWVEGKYRKYGVGIITGEVCLVDIDCYDKTMAERIRSHVQAEYGHAPERIGQAPKVGLLFRVDEPFKKISTPFYVNADWDEEEKHKVEILGQGQQFVAYHVHPDTKKPYTWKGEASPYRIPRADLPELTREQALEIKDFAEQCFIDAGWTPKRGKASSDRKSLPAVRGKIDTDDVFATDSPKVEDLSAEEIREKLRYVNENEDYDTWLQVGMALNHQFDGSDDGLELWEDWSRSGSNYECGACQRKWPTLDEEGKNRPPVTFRYIMKLAQARKKEIEKERLEELLQKVEKTTSHDELDLLVQEEIKPVRWGELQFGLLTSAISDKIKVLKIKTMTPAAVRAWARYQRAEKEGCPKWLEEWVFLTLNKGVFYSRESREPMDVSAFNAAFGRNMLTPLERREGKSVPETKPQDFALNRIEIPVVHNAIYYPGEDDFFFFNGREVVNSYSDRGVPEAPGKLSRGDREAIDTVKKHLDMLYPVESDRGVLLDGIAYIVQNPGKRLNFAFLLMGVEGEGKSWFNGLFKAVLGPQNVYSIPASLLGEQYTPWAAGHQVVCVEEVKIHGQNRFDITNKFKPYITNPVVTVREMYRGAFEAPNMTSYFLFTNYLNGLPINEDDSRYFPLISRFQTREELLRYLQKHPGYFERLFGVLQGHAGALRRFFLEWEISPTFNAQGRAPESSGKAVIADTNRNPAEDYILDLLNDPNNTDPSLTFEILDITKLQQMMLEEGIPVPATSAFSNILTNLNFQPLHRIRVKGESTQHRLYSRNRRKFVDERNKPIIDKINRWLVEL